MALKKGVCKNFENCTLADNNEIQEVDSSEFRCTECGKELHEISDEGSHPAPKKIILIIVAAIILIGGGIWAYFGLIKDRQKVEESVSLSLDKEVISLYVGDSDTLTTTVSIQPSDAKISVSFTSDNSNVVSLDNDGDVKAIAQGEACITVIARMESGVADTSFVKVSVYEKSDTVKPAQPNPRDNIEPGSTSSGNSNVTMFFSIGKYVGELKNGIPEGSGKFYYNCHVQIAKHDTDNPPHYAEAGDWFDGTWGNGDIISGALYGKDGRIKEKIFAPKRFNPYDLNKERCQ